MALSSRPGVILNRRPRPTVVCRQILYWNRRALSFYVDNFSFRVHILKEQCTASFAVLNSSVLIGQF